jgi:hypothetical protein
MRSSFLGWNEFFNFAAEKNDTNFVVVLNSRKGQYSSYFGNHLLFKLNLGAKCIGTTYIDQKHYGKFPFLLKNLHIGMVEPCCNIPVDRTDIIAKLILPDFGKSHTTSLEGTLVAPCKHLVGDPLVLISILLTFFDQFFGFHNTDENGLTW